MTEMEHMMLAIDMLMAGLLMLVTIIEKIKNILK